MFLKWLNIVNKRTIFLNENTFHKWKAEIGNQIEVCYGGLNIFMDLKIDPDLPEDTVSLSYQLTENITFPKDVIYEVQLNDKQLLIGPLIGMMISKYQKDLTVEKLELLKERVTDYHKLKGVVFVSTHDLIDEDNNLMSGYYYSPTNGWKKGVFPFPKVLINRPYIKKHLFQKLTRENNMHVLNNCSMTKDKLWRLLSTDRSVNRFVPYTQRLNGVNSLIEMLKKYKSVYLKPSNLSKGRGIYYVKQTSNGMIFQHGSNKEVSIMDKERLPLYLNKITKNRLYIIQQAVPYKVGERLIDFRIYLQKDGTLDWNCSGIYCRLSKPNSVVTNLRHSQEILAFKNGLKKYFGFAEEEIMDMEHQMIRVSKKICKALEERGQIIADVALDMVIDPQIKIWVLEVQVNYANDERLYQLPPEIHKKVWTTPLQYAKALTHSLR